MPRIHQERAHAFLRERNGASFSIPEMARATGWSESTVKTYIPKHWRPWLTRVGAGTYRVDGFDRVSLGDFMRRQSQVKSESPDNLQDDTATPQDDYLSDAEWAELTRSLRNDASVITEVQTLLRRISDNLDYPSDIRRSAEAADVLLDTIAEFVKTGEPDAEQLARASSSWLRALAAKILRGARQYDMPIVEIARKLLEMLSVG